MIKVLSADDLRSLKHGDFVYRQISSSFRRLRYVARMPGNEKYLIFCDGEFLTCLYINDSNNDFSYTWYSGELSSKDIDILTLKYYEDRIVHIKSIVT